MASSDKPEEMGDYLKLIGDVGYYDWDWWSVGAFIDERDGRFRVAGDSGCSCNGPWEFFTDADYGPPLSARDACAEIMKTDVPHGEDPTAFRRECLDLCDAIHKADAEYKAARG